MATLRGQNFRILTYDSSTEKYSVVGMATNCTVNLNTNTDDGSNKDITGMAARPNVMSKNWQVSVKSLDVADIYAILSAVKASTPFVLLWDETNTSNNQTAKNEGFCRRGTAFLSDVTFQFDNRTNSVKSLQFSGTSALEKLSQTPTVQTISPSNTYTQGQYVRLFLSSDNTTASNSVIAAARTLSFHCSVQLEDATTKDTVGDWQVQEPIGISFDISTSALVRSGETITSQVGAKSLADLMDIYEASSPIRFSIANVEGDNNRARTTVIITGSVIIASIAINAANRQVTTYDAQFQGYGSLGLTPPNS